MNKIYFLSAIFVFEFCLYGIAKTAEYSQVHVAKAVLRQADEDGFLDAKSKQVFDSLQTSEDTPLERYIALIEECQRKESFLDVVGSTDEWDRYVTEVQK